MAEIIINVARIVIDVVLIVMLVAYLKKKEK